MVIDDDAALRLQPGLHSQLHARLDADGHRRHLARQRQRAAVFLGLHGGYTAFLPKHLHQIGVIGGKNPYHTGKKQYGL